MENESINCSWTTDVSLDSVANELGLCKKTVAELVMVKNGWIEPSKVTEIILMADEINRQKAPK